MKQRSLWLWHHLPLVALCGVFVALALSFSSGPIFEAPDEIEHYRYLRSLAQSGMLPDPGGQFRGQYHQAPLYYVLLAPLKAWLPDGDFALIDGRLNPYYPHLIAVPGNDNKALYLHSRAEQFPYTGSPTALAVHVLRLTSVALGLGTLLISAAIFALLWPDRPDRRLVATAVVACLPQFAYLSGSLNNDNLLFLLSTLSLYLVLRQRRDGPSVRLAVWLGVCLGAALLTKLNALFLVFPVGLAVLLDRRTWWPYAPLTLGVVAVVAGWWFVRNWALYGDPTLIRVLLSTWQAESIRGGALAFDVGLSRLPYTYQTFWARFGQGAVAVAASVTQLFEALTLVTLLGASLGTIRAWRRRSSAWQPAVIVAVYTLAWVASVVYYASTVWSGNQGRYLLPGVAGWGAVIAFGLESFTPRRWRAALSVASAVGLAGVAFVCAFSYFLPSYRVATPPASSARPLMVQYHAPDGEPVANLIGLSPATPHGRPGQIITITLVWQAVRAAAASDGGSLQTYLHSVGSDVIKRDSMPGTGLLLSTEWQAGETWAEHYQIALPADAEAQQTFALVAGLYDPAARRALTARRDGRDAEPIIGRVAVSSEPQALPTTYRLGEIMALATPQLSVEGRTLTVCLAFHSLAITPVDYSVFVHVLPETPGEPPAQVDAQPRGGRYPTSVWQPGETVNDCLALTLPADRASRRVGIGLYDPLSNTRLPVREASNAPLADGMIIVTLPQ
jgi:Predicted membrane protein (DUF2142)